MLIKICGIRTVQHALAAVAAGADLIGLVFAPSRRQVTLAEASAIARAIGRTPAPRPRLVGLFVNTAPASIRPIVAQVGLDLVQLSGDEPLTAADDLPLALIKAIRMDGSGPEAAWVERAAASPPAGQALGAVTLLVDAHVPGSFGGTGVIADWGRAAALSAQAPTLLAGGLTPANVAAAIAAVRPFGVDVSSGVETDGVKDPTKIRAFVGAARAAQG